MPAIASPLVVLVVAATPPHPAHTASRPAESSGGSSRLASSQWSAGAPAMCFQHVLVVGSSTPSHTDATHSRFTVPSTTQLMAIAEPSGHWQECSPRFHPGSDVAPDGQPTQLSPSQNVPGSSHIGAVAHTNPSRSSVLVLHGRLVSLVPFCLDTAPQSLSSESFSGIPPIRVRRTRGSVPGSTLSHTLYSEPSLHCQSCSTARSLAPTQWNRRETKSFARRMLSTTAMSVGVVMDARCPDGFQATHHACASSHPSDGAPPSHFQHRCDARSRIPLQREGTHSALAAPAATSIANANPLGQMQASTPKLASTSDVAPAGHAAHVAAVRFQYVPGSQRGPVLQRKPAVAAAHSTSRISKTPSVEALDTAAQSLLSPIAEKSGAPRPKSGFMISPCRFFFRSPKSITSQSLHCHNPSSPASLAPTHSFCSPKFPKDV
mmetsp:Transcript_61709/g.145127  ORF Transcript_61709/g.145127 Transcript_61709/m.145127 type:complete len:435 (+) Transcript_61709:1631-2935(+)